MKDLRKMDERCTTCVQDWSKTWKCLICWLNSFQTLRQHFCFMSHICILSCGNENILRSERCQQFIIYYCKSELEEETEILCVCVCVPYRDRIQNNTKCCLMATHTHTQTDTQSDTLTWVYTHSSTQRSRESLYKEVILLLMMPGALVRDINT